MIPKHFSLVKEHPQSYEIHDSRVKKNFHVAKSGLDLAMHGKLSKIPKFADGGAVDISPGSASSAGASSTPASLEQDTQSSSNAVAPQDDGVFGVPDVSPSAPVPVNDTINYPIDTAISTQAGPDRSIAQSPISDPDTQGASSEDPAAAALTQLPKSQNQILNEELGSVRAAAGAQAKQAQDTAAAYSLYNAQHEVSMNDLKNNMAKRQQQDEELFKNYMGKKLDPDSYWDNKSTGSKIGAGLGMLFSGMGSATTGQPNLAMQNINNAINRDMEAQKQDKSDAMNAWKLHREATNDNMSANLAFQNQALLGVQSKAAEYAARAGDPAAQMKYAQLKSGLQQQIAQNNFHSSMLSSANQGSTLNVDPSLLLPSIPADKQGEAAKEIANAQKVKSLQNDFESSAKDLQSKAMNGLFSPHDRASAVNAFAGQIATASEHRFNMDESKSQADALLPAPGDGASTLQNKAVRRQQFFSSMVQAPVFKGSTGIDIGKFKSTSTAAGPTDADIQKNAQINYVKQNLNNPNPQVRARVQFVRQKYGM